mgnify:CR=1 FL=1
MRNNHSESDNEGSIRIVGSAGFGPVSNGVDWESGIVNTAVHSIWQIIWIKIFVGQKVPQIIRIFNEGLLNQSERYPGLPEVRCVDRKQSSQ